MKTISSCLTICLCSSGFLFLHALRGRQSYWCPIQYPSHGSEHHLDKTPMADVLLRQCCASVLVFVALIKGGTKKWF